MSPQWLPRRGRMLRATNARLTDRASRRNRRLDIESLEQRLVLSTSLPLTSGAWTAIGPAPILSGQTPGRMPVSGRIAAVAASTTDPNLIYVAAANGGVWKTINGGSNWTALTDNQATLHMGAIAIAPSNPNVLYAGTGEANAFLGQRSPFLAPTVFSGRGVLKSTDAGSTWTLLGQSHFDRRSISKLAIDPVNSNIVYVAVGQTGGDGLPGNEGIWKTTDGGVTWTNTTTSLSSQDAYTDIAMDPSNSQVLYAAIGQNTIDPTTFNGTGSPVNGIYKTINGGNTWTRAGDFPAGSGDGRISISIAASSPNIIYSSIVDPATFGLNQIVKSTNGGTTWVNLTNAPDYFNGQGPYDSTIAVSPTNPNVVFAAGAGTYQTGGQSVVESTDGGTTWSEISGFGGTSGPHPDHHGMTFDASGHLLDTNDGGIWRLQDPNASAPVWNDLNGNLQITTFTGIALDPSNFNIAYGGSQDNGTEKFNDALGWKLIQFGDGGYVRVDHNNPNTIYHTFFGDSLERSDDGGQTWNFIAPFQANFDNSNFYIPYLLDPNNQSRILFGSDHVYVSPDKGANWSAIATPGQNGFNPNGDPIDSIAVAPTDSNTIYVAAAGHVFVTLDAGRSWNEQSVPTGGDFISDLYVDPANSLTAYATRGAFNDPVNTGHVFKTTDGGTTWKDISGNLPNVPAYSFASLTLPAGTTRLFAGTDVGVYASADNGQSWSKYKTGMPNVQVTSLEVDTGLNILAAGTHGRGMFEISSLDPLTVQGVGTLRGVVGSATDFTNIQVATFTDSPSDPANLYSAVIDWGDGTQTTGAITQNGSNYVVTGSHIYDVYGSFTMSVTITNPRQSSDTVTNPVVVADAPIVGTPLTLNVHEGLTINQPIATFTSGNPAALPGQFTATIRWGDNTTTPGTVTAIPGGGFGVQGNHSYRQAGTYVATVTVVSRGGSKATIKSSVVVADSPIVTTPVTIQGVESVPFTGIVATYVDSSQAGIASDFNATIDWGDSTPSSVATIKADGNHFDVVASHLYPRFGTYPITVSIVNSPKTLTYMVNSSDVVGDASIIGTAGSVVATIGSPFNSVVATYSDVNANGLVSDLTATIDWGNGQTTPGVITLTGPGKYAVSGGITYFNPGSPQVTVTLVSAGGAVIAPVSYVGRVNDAPLDVNFAGTAVGPAQDPSASQPGLTVTLGQDFNGTLATFTSTDPNAKVGDFGVTINWGDGTQTSGTLNPVASSATTSQFLVNAEHLYNSAGSFPLSLVITSRGGTATRSNGASQVLSPLNGHLDPASDTGISNTDGITRSSQFLYQGTGVANAAVTLFARPTNGSAGATPIGSSFADGLGNWSIYTNVPLADGSYLLSVQSKNVNGQVLQSKDFNASPITIDQTPPTVQSVSLDAVHGRATIVFNDNGSGVIPAGLLNPGSYYLMLPGKRGTSSFTPVSVTPDASLSGGGQQAVTVSFKTKGRLVNGAYVFAINSNNLADVAGNALYERNFVTFPQLANLPINTFVAQFNVQNGQAGGATPYIPIPEIIAAQNYTNLVHTPGGVVRIRRSRHH